MAMKIFQSPLRGSQQYRYELDCQYAKITDYLYLCSHAAVQRTEKLKRLGLTAEVNVTPHLPYSELPLPKKMRIAVSDIPSVLIKRYFSLFVKFINDIRNMGGRTIVYCECGVSRSATLCMVYLVTHEQMNLYEAYAHIKLMRGIINPNEGFWKQLVEYEKEETGQSSVKIERAF